MALPAAVYPDALWDGNEQSTANDGPADTTIAQGADHNEIAAELQEVEKFNREGTLRAFRNDTGGTLTKGTLVHISGRDVGTDLPTVTKSQADDLLTLAEAVVAEDVLNNANGNLATRRIITGLNTAGFSVGDPVYLDASTAGDFQDVAPTGVNYGQWCGRVTEVDASTGQVEFNISRPAIPDQIGLEYAIPGGDSTLGLKNKGVTAAKLADAVQDQIHGVNITAGAEAGDEITFTIQALDADGNNLSERILVHFWISDVDLGAPDNDVNETIVISASYPLIDPAVPASGVRHEVMTDATGKMFIDVTNTGSVTRFLMATAGGSKVDNQTATWA